MEPTQLLMTKHSFRMANIHVRRPLRVDGLDAVPINVSPSKGIEMIRGSTEVCRAIHGKYHEPQITNIAGDRFRRFQHIIVFRQAGFRYHRHCAERLHWRCGVDRLGFGDARSELDRSWSDDAGNRVVARQAQSPAAPERLLDF